MEKDLAEKLLDRAAFLWNKVNKGRTQPWQGQWTISKSDHAALVERAKKYSDEPWPDNAKLLGFPLKIVDVGELKLEELSGHPE